jgi:hypothetical protein
MAVVFRCVQPSGDIRARGGMMRHLIVATALFCLIATPAVPVLGQTPPTAGSSLGNITLPRPVLADGQPLAAGTYQVRLSSDAPTPAVGQSPEGARYVEFMRGGKVVGREVATVISAEEVGQIAKGRRPTPGSARVELLKGEDYLRVWINRGGVNFIIHLPPAKA